jgi:Ca-activated chloride channel family protein
MMTHNRKTFWRTAISGKKLFHRLMSACVLLLLGVAVIFAQQGSPLRHEQPTPSSASGGQSPSQQPKKEIEEGAGLLRERTEVVTLIVTVTDRHGQAVTGLTREHFEIFEDKVKQNIEYFRDDDALVSVGIIFDVSSSMEGKLNYAREAVRTFIQTSHQDDDFFLIAFNDHPRLLGAFLAGDTVMKLLSGVEAHGNTALYDAVYLGLEKIKQGRHRKHALLLITDGGDNASRYKFKELRRSTQESDTLVYSIGVGVTAEGASILGKIANLVSGGVAKEDRLAPEKLARWTGAQVFFPFTVAELEEAASLIALELRRQYSLGYVPTNLRHDGKWRTIRVRVKPPRQISNVMARAREGYYAARTTAARQGYRRLSSALVTVSW